MRFMTFAALGLAFAVAAAAGEGGLGLSEDDLVFRYRPGRNPALAELGGAVRGNYKPELETVETDGVKGLRFRNPGTGSLSFPTAGNLAPTQGTVLMDLAYDIDIPAVHAAVNKEGKWSKQFFLFQAMKDGAGVGLMIDVIAKAPADQFTLGLMTAKEPQKWEYTNAFEKAAALPRGQRVRVGFTWKGDEVAVVVGDRLVGRTTLKTGLPAEWNSWMTFGGTGGGAFDGTLYAVEIYQASCLPGAK